MNHKEGQKAPMICGCGAEMNHHAMKIDYRRETPELREVHTCPECGRTESRQAGINYD